MLKYPRTESESDGGIVSKIVIYLGIVLLMVGIVVQGTKTWNAKTLQQQLKQGDDEFAANHFDKAEQLYRLVLKGDQSSPFKSQPIVLHQIQERLAITLCMEDKPEEALSFFSACVIGRLQQFDNRRASSSLDRDYAYNSYGDAIHISRILFNYAQVLSFLHRENEASEQMKLIWTDLLAHCRSKHERMQVAKNAADRLRYYLHSSGNPSYANFAQQCADAKALPDDEAKTTAYVDAIRAVAVIPPTKLIMFAAH